MGQLIDALLQLSRITRAEITRERRRPFSHLPSPSPPTSARKTPDGDARPSPSSPASQVEGDPKLLHVALENLLGNAVKFSSQGRRTRSSTSAGTPKQQAWFVQDNGAGFDMYYADKLFNAFNRLHGDKDFKGSGIGLATVARVIRRHHGRIWADSASIMARPFGLR